MGRTLNLTDCLLAMAVEAQDQGRTRDACHLLTRLLRFRDLPRALAEEAHARLAEVLLQEKKFAKARRHLAVLMCLRPSMAKYYYQYGQALHRDPRGDKHRAVKYYQQALDLDPTRARWWAAFGKLQMDLGQSADAVATLQHATELDGDDPVIVGRLARALCLDERADEARDCLQQARFAHPKDGRFRKLWNDHQFQQAACEQSPRSDEPVLLPFVRRSVRPVHDPVSGAIFRLDDARPVQAPHARSRTARREV